MNSMTDNLRLGLAALAEEAHPMDLRDRALRTSRRLAVRRTVAGAILAGVAVGLLTTTVALALPSEEVVPPVPPASPATPSVSAEPAPPATTEPAPPATESAGPVESQAPVGPDIPEAAMLQAEDLGPGYQADDDTVSHHGSVSMLLAYCGRVHSEESLGSRLRAFSSGDGVYTGQQEVYRYGDGGAARVMDHVRDALPACQRIEVQGNPEYVSELTVLQTDFAGDESILLREVYTTPDQTITRYQVVLRQGDLYAQTLLEVESEGRARDIAIAAAQRLCEGTATC